MQTDFPSTATYASLGRRLRARRIAMQMGVAEVAARLRVPVAVVEAMEHDDPTRIAATVSARARLIGYAGLVGVPVAAVEAQFAHALLEPAPLEARSIPTVLERALQILARPGMQATAVAAIALALVWVASRGPAEASPLAATAQESAAADGAQVDATASGNAGVPGSSTASLIPLDDATPPPRGGASATMAIPSRSANPTPVALSSGGKSAPAHH
jgi:cytoskeleton protein RodZ